ncbi:MAG: MetQ/NlpA family ABC transporter substrate-binding protein [Halanaerobiales bacterium]
MDRKNLFILLAVIIVLVIALMVYNFTGRDETKVLRVGATPLPHSEILQFVKPLMLEEGIELEIVEFTDYVTPNLALDEGGIDVNFFQHQPYLDSFNQDHNLSLVTVARIHVEPFGLYSEKIDSIDELSDGAVIAVPNDPTNEGRALLLLENKGYIKLDAENELEATPVDITENPKNLEFRELEAAQLPRVLPDVTAAFINTNYALEADLNPLEDALIIEGEESPYANILVVKEGNQDNEMIQTLVEVITTDKVRDFILDEYEGSVVPVF